MAGSRCPPATTRSSSCRSRNGATRLSEHGRRAEAALGPGCEPKRAAERVEPALHRLADKQAAARRQFEDEGIALRVEQHLIQEIERAAAQRVGEAQRQP